MSARRPPPRARAQRSMATVASSVRSPPRRTLNSTTTRQKSASPSRAESLDPVGLSGEPGVPRPRPCPSSSLSILMDETKKIVREAVRHTACVDRRCRGTWSGRARYRVPIPTSGNLPADVVVERNQQRKDYSYIQAMIYREKYKTRSDYND
jgi:hypothetical protein